MSIPISKTIIASTSGSTVKHVTCEGCGCEYYYELARSADALSSSLFGLDDASAQKRAEKGASEKLAGVLKDDSEVVPCPECGLIQQRMVANARRRKYRGLFPAGLMMLVLGLGYVFAGVVLGESKSFPTEAEETRRRILILVAASMAAIGGLLLLLRLLLLRRLSTSGDDAWLMEAMQGAPPALLADDEPDEEGDYHLHPAPRFEHSGRRVEDGTVIFCLLRVGLPEVCCQCLKPTTSTYRPIAIMRGWGKFESMPLCHPCSRAQAARSWIGVVMATLMATSASILVAMLIPDATPGGRVSGAMMASIFATALAIGFIPAVLAEPFAMKRIDEERGLVRIRFGNRSYARLVRKRVAEVENLPASAV